MNKIEVIGNLSTIIKILICIFAPALAVYLKTDENTAEALLVAVAGLLFGLIDAKFVNSFFNNDDERDVNSLLPKRNDEQ